MSRKRRVFDIDLPNEIDTPAPETKSTRRGPMASAINENAEALKARVTAAEAIREENDSLAHEYVALRDAGQVVQMIPLEDVHTYMLVRDRMLKVDDLELEELVTSIRELGTVEPDPGHSATRWNGLRAGARVPAAECVSAAKGRSGRGGVGADSGACSAGCAGYCRTVPADGRRECRPQRPVLRRDGACGAGLCWPTLQPMLVTFPMRLRPCFSRRLTRSAAISDRLPALMDRSGVRWPIRPRCRARLAWPWRGC